MGHEAAQTLSHADYLALEETKDEERFEFHDGVVVAMGAPTVEHQRIGTRLAGLLEAALADTRGLPIAGGVKVRVEATNRTLVPDLVVACEPLERSEVDPKALVSPRVVVEILSPRTADYDLGGKFAHYRRLPALQEYVTVAQDRHFVSVARRVGDLWRFEDMDEGAIRLESVNVELAIAEIYADRLGEILSG